jgi:uncharacterized protein with HEPN domain
MKHLTNDNYANSSIKSLSNFCIGHWVVSDDFTSNTDSPIGWQQAKNMRDHVMLEFARATKNSVSQVVSKDLTHVISRAIKTKKKYLLVVRDYTFKIGQLIPALTKFVEEDLEDAVIVGHLLDWKTQYYEIHHQAFIIDLEWYITAGKPPFKDGFKKGDWQATDVERSVENFHAPEIDHTPIWIKGTNKTKTYHKWRHGGLVVAKAMQMNMNVKPFPTYLRDAKTYLYPELKHEHYHHFQNYLDNMAGNQFFAVNTESIWKDAPGEEYDMMFVPASGVIPIVAPYINKLNVGGQLCIFDNSPISLRYAQYMDKWQGPAQDIELYINKFIHTYNEFEYVGTPEQVTKTKEWIADLGEDFAEWYVTARPFIKRTTQTVNFMYFDQYKRMLDQGIEDFRQSYPESEYIKIYINISNIFHYPPNSFMFSLRYRTEVLNQILEYNNSIENVTIDCTYVGLDKPINLIEALDYKEH